MIDPLTPDQDSKLTRFREYLHGLAAGPRPPTTC
jgi:hypothetical protein